MNNKKLYRDLCANESSIPLFSKDWWLDAVCHNGEWDVGIVRNGGNVIASMPYFVKKYMGMTFIEMPKLTQTLGPWLSESNVKYSKQLSQQKKNMSELIQTLPYFVQYTQKFHYSITNWLPFYWKGFNQTTRYTYVIDDLSDLDSIWNNFQGNIRREIRKAQKIMCVYSDMDINNFFDINTQTFTRQKKKVPYTRELVCRIDAACRKQNAGRIFYAKDDDGQIHAAIYIVWDRESAYYLMGGADLPFRRSGAFSLLMWEAIQFASTVTKRFDFEGSMIEQIERYFRAFGARQKRYFRITKYPSIYFKLIGILIDLNRRIHRGSF